MKLKDHLTELIDGEPQYLGPGDDIWAKLDELGFLEAEVYEGEACDFALWVDGSDQAKYPALDMGRIRVIVAPLKE